MDTEKQYHQQISHNKRSFISLIRFMIMLSMVIILDEISMVISMLDVDQTKRLIGML